MTASLTLRALLGAAIAMSLSACGGSSTASGAPRSAHDAPPMPLNDHDAVVRAVAATLNTATVFGLGEPWERPAAEDPDTVTVEDCDEGRIVYDEPQLTTTFENCRLAGDDNVTAYIDGGVDENCQGSGDADQCINVGTDAPLRLGLEGDEQQTHELNLSVTRFAPEPGVVADWVLGGRYSFVRQAPYEERANTHSLSFILVQSLDDSGTGQADISGDFVYESDAAHNCTNGVAYVSTDESLELDGFDITGGSLHIENDDEDEGDSADIAFDSDGGFNYTLSNGASGHVSWEELYNVCGYETYSDSEELDDPVANSCTLEILGICVLSGPAQSPLGGTPL